jgi:hypothetical protein
MRMLCHGPAPALPELVLGLGSDREKRCELAALTLRPFRIAERV